MEYKNRTILHLDMNAYFASVEQSSNPSLKGKPIAVGGGNNKTTIIATCSYEARKFGVKTGMPVWQAKKICPHLIVVPGNMDKYIYTSKEIYKILFEYTNLVEIFSIDEAFLDITFTKDKFGGEKNLAKDIKTKIKEKFNLTCSIGIGPNKLIAKLASEMQKPDGLTYIREEEIPAIFEFIPIENLCGIGDRLKKKLNTLGIKTCADLGRYPLQKLINKFGLVSGIHLHNMGNGIDETEVNPKNNSKNAKSIGHSTTLPKEENNIDKINGYILRLCEQIGIRARKDNYFGKVVGLFLRYNDFSSYHKQKNIHHFTNDGFEIYKTALEMLEFKKPIRHIGIRLSNLIKNAQQINLFEINKKNTKLLSTIDEINNKYGNFTILRASAFYANISPKVGMTTKQNLF